MRTVVCERFLMPLLCALGLLLGAHAARADTAPTYIYVTPRTGIPGNPVAFYAVLSRTTDQTRLNGETLTFKLDAGTANETLLGTAVTGHLEETNEDGATRLDYTLPADMTAGPHTITVEFGGDADNAATTGTGTLTVGKANTYLYVTPRSGHPGQRVAFFGVLSRNVDHSVKLNGETLTFKLDAGTANETLLGTATTGYYAVANENGSAQLDYTLPDNISAGEHTITVEFAGDDNNLPSTGQATLTVISNDTVQTGESHGTIATDSTHSVYIDMTVFRHVYSDGHSDISGSALLNGTTADGQTIATSIWASALDFSWVTVQGQQCRHVQVTTNTFGFVTGGQRVRAYLQVDATAIPGGAGQMGFKVIRASDGTVLTASTDADGNYAELPLEVGGWTVVRF